MYGRTYVLMCVCVCVCVCVYIYMYCIYNGFNSYPKMHITFFFRYKYNSDHYVALRNFLTSWLWQNLSDCRLWSWWFAHIQIYINLCFRAAYFFGMDSWVFCLAICPVWKCLIIFRWSRLLVSGYSHAFMPTFSDITTWLVCVTIPICRETVWNSLLTSSVVHQVQLQSLQ